MRAAKFAGMRALLPLFLVSAAAVGYEIALTRYFAIAKWSEYGYWVISIVMAGFALSGVVVALARAALGRHAAVILRVLPPVLMALAALGFHFTTTNPFNPLQLQNQVTWAPQLGNIALYYAALLPFFFAAGLFVSLSFISNARRIGLVYGFDLAGAGAGALLVLGLMLVVHPFHLVVVLLLPLAAAGLLDRGRGRSLVMAASLVVLAGSAALLLLDDAADYNDFKAIYAPLHVPGSRTLAEIRAPRGLYTLLDDFTERVDTDVSNDAGMLGVAGPPTSFGLYRDGNRVAALPRPDGTATPYAMAALDALPYLLLAHPAVVLAGSSGGFRVREALSLGAAHVTALETEPVLFDALRHGLGPSPALAPDARVTLRPVGPVAAMQGLRAPVDLVDISADFLDAGEANAHAFTAEALRGYLAAVRPGGILSIPVSIREFPAYAVRMLATVREALLQSGVTDPAGRVVVYRSAWNVRILVSNRPFAPAMIAAVRKFCDDRSFDVSFYPGIDIVAARKSIYNDLPAVSFDSGEVTSNGPDDAVADEAQATLAGVTTASDATFNLQPITDDRPFFYDVLRLDRLGVILAHIDALPQAEIGPLVNLAVLGQAIVIAIIVLLVPFARPGAFSAKRRAAPGFMLRTVFYFAALGLGFLFIEITMIDKVAFYLDSRATAFALVLTAMLIFGGLGAMLSTRFAGRPRAGVGLASVVIVAWCILLILGLQPGMMATVTLPWGLRVLLVLLLLAPVSVALGLPFPLGLMQAGAGEGDALLPWAWALNGAFSVVATPLANLLALGVGFNRVLLGAAILYGLCYIAFPTVRKSLSWQDFSAV